MQLAPEPEVPGAIRKRQLVLPQSVHGAILLSPHTVLPPRQLCSNRFCSLLSNHGSQTSAPREGGDAEMRTVDQRLWPGQEEHGKKGFASHSTTLMVWEHKGNHLVDAGTSSGNRWDTARNTSPAWGLAVAFVRPGEEMSRELQPWFAPRLARGRGRERERRGLGMCQRPVTKHLLTFP